MPASNLPLDIPTIDTPVTVSPANKAAEMGEDPLCAGKRDGWTTKHLP